MAMLEVNNLSIQFGGLRAVDGFNMTIEKGQLYGLIGPNGAGKTTVFNLLTGVYKPTEGIIRLDGQDITGKSTIEINKAGIARTFQNIRLFKDMPVLDNVKVGLHNHHPYSTLTGILRLPKYYKVEKEMNERAMEILKVFDLDKEADTLAGNLPYCVPDRRGGLPDPSGFHMVCAGCAGRAAVRRTGRAGVAANHAVRGGVRRSAGAAVAAGKEIPEFQGHGHQCGLRRRLRWPRHGGY